MDSPEKIPLQEAVARGLIPCSACGVTGASPESLGGKRHFVCLTCARRLRRRVWAVAALALAVVAVGAFVLTGGRPGARDGEAQAKAFLDEVDRLMVQGRYAEARDLLAPALDQAPNVIPLNEKMGRCLDQLGHYEAGLPIWHRMTTHPATEAEGRVLLGKAYMLLGHSASALPFLEQPVASAAHERDRRTILAECHLDLERYEDALRALDGASSDARLHYRILARLGRDEEAGRVLQELRAQAESDPKLRPRLAQLEAIRKRESGDLAGARAVLDSARSSFEAGSAEASVLTRSTLLVDLESGDLGRLISETDVLAKTPSAQFGAEAMWFRMLAHLAAGRRDDAVAAAKEGLDRVDPFHALVRQKVWTFQHLLGRRKDEDLVAEAKRVHRFTANEIYYYMALSTGKKEWAEKALETTVGRDFPYHAIRRLLGK